MNGRFRREQFSGSIGAPASSYCKVDEKVDVLDARGGEDRLFALEERGAPAGL